MKFNDEVEVDAFKVDTNGERKMPAKVTPRKAPCNLYNCKSADKASSNSKTSSKAIEPASKKVNIRNDIDEDEAMLEEETNFPSSRFNSDGKRQGFGS